MAKASSIPFTVSGARGPNDIRYAGRVGRSRQGPPPLEGRRRGGRTRQCPSVTAPRGVGRERERRVRHRQRRRRLSRARGRTARRREHAGSRGAMRRLVGLGTERRLRRRRVRPGCCARRATARGPRAPVGDQDALLLCVWGTSAKDVWAGASGGKIFHSDGRGTWQPQAVPDKSQVQAIFGFEPNDLNAAAGKLFHSTGDGHWTAVDDARGSPARAPSSATRVATFFVGANDGQLFRRKSGAWSHTRATRAEAIIRRSSSRATISTSAPSDPRKWIEPEKRG